MHLCVCAFAALVSAEGWNWIWVLMLDLPLLYAQKYIGDRLGFVLISPLCVALLGTAWWLCIGFAIDAIRSKVVRARA